MAEEVVVKSEEKGKEVAGREERKPERREEEEEMEVVSYEKIKPDRIRAVLNMKLVGEGIEGLCNFIEKCVTDYIGVPQFIVKVTKLEQPWVIARCWDALIKGPGGPIINVPEELRRFIANTKDDWYYIWELVCMPRTHRSIGDLLSCLLYTSPSPRD